MKKTLFALFAVPLVLMSALLLAACDLYVLSPNTGAGQSMARLSINLGGGGTSRALTTELAKDAVDYYEVVFKAPNGVFYQAEWGKDETGFITIPVGNYDGVPNGPNDAGAVMFAGKKTGNDHTLLAIGVISSVKEYDKPDSPGAIIKSTTESVTFTLTALKNDVNDTNGSTPGASTFQILAPSGYSTYSGNNTIDKEIGFEYPVFSIPSIVWTDDSISRPNYDVSGDGFITGSYKVICGNGNTLFTAVKLNGDWNVFLPGGSYTVLGISGLTTGVTGMPRKPAGGATLTDGEFVFHINLGSTPITGYCKIYIDVPVNALSATSNAGPTIVWHIRGGTDNTAPDEGINVSPKGSTGGAVILKIVP